MKKTIAVLFLALAGGISFAQGHLFQFKYKEGDAYRVLFYR